MIEQPKLYEMTLEETLEYLNSTKPQSKSVSPPEKKKEDELPQYLRAKAYKVALMVVACKCSIEIGPPCGRPEHTSL